MKEIVTFFGALFLLAAILFFYFVPTLIAFKNRKRSIKAIFVLNALLGWCVVGWIAALVWACTYEPAMRDEENFDL